MRSHAFTIWATDPEAAGEMLERAGAMAERLGDPAVRSDVLNNLAAGRFTRREDWTGPMNEALQLGLESGGLAQAGRAYANAYTYFAAQHRFAEGERYWREGIAYCDEHDVTTFSTCLRGHRAVALMDLGRGTRRSRSPSGSSPPRRARSTSSPRRSRSDWSGRGAWAPACTTCSTPPCSRPRRRRRGGVDRQHPAGASRGPLARGNEAAALADLARIRAVVTPMEYLEDAQLAVWEIRLTGRPDPVSPPPEPWATWLAGDHRAAAARWDRTWAAATTPPWPSTTPTATTTCVRRSPASRHSAPTPARAVPVGG